MVYLRNVSLRWSVTADEKQAEQLISHGIGFDRGFDLELLSSSRGEREREIWGF